MADSYDDLALWWRQPVNTLGGQVGPAPAPYVPQQTPSERGVSRWLRSYGVPGTAADVGGAAAALTPFGGAYDAGAEIGQGNPWLGAAGLTLAALPLGVARRIPNPIRAYHGSPHAFDEFRLDRIGTGEGAQAYGHGLYFAESEPVARSYRDKFANAARTQTTLTEAERSLVPTGHMYEVNIHARPEQFLDWDSPLAQQGEVVRRQLGLEAMPQRPSMQEVFATRRGTPEREALERRVENLNADQWRAVGFDPAPQFPNRVEPYFPGDVTGEHYVRLLARRAGERHRTPPSSDPFDTLSYMPITDHMAAAQTLRGAGIPGIRYLDQSSRGAGHGTSNYVLFDPSVVEILRRYGIAAPIVGAPAATAIMADKQTQY